MLKAFRYFLVRMQTDNTRKTGSCTSKRASRPVKVRSLSVSLSVSVSHHSVSDMSLSVSVSLSPPVCHLCQSVSTLSPICLSLSPFLSICLCLPLPEREETSHPAAPNNNQFCKIIVEMKTV